MTLVGERFRPMLDSLQVRLVSGLLIPLAAIVIVNLSLAHRNAMEKADLVLNDLLLASTNAIAEHVRANGRGFDVYIPPFALATLTSPENDLAYYRVSGPHGELLAGYPDIPTPPVAVLGSEPGYYDVTFHNERVRFAAIAQVVFYDHLARNATVIVGKTLRARDALVRTLELQAAVQQGVLIIIAVVLAWLGLRRDLAPLVRLGRELDQRKPDRLVPLSTDAVRTELRPFVMALNDYLTRQRQQLVVQRRFAGNAAHQLRTPITLLRMQADYALREPEDEKRIGALRAVASTTDQMARITKQLLTLSQAEVHRESACHEEIDLMALVRNVLEACAGVALSRDIDLGFEARTPGMAVTRGDPTLLRELILNLVENALRYVPAGGTVTVAVSRDDKACVLRVEDDGVGIPPAERELVFERFYRILGRCGEGSGLGLAIVKEIVESSGGTVTLADPEHGSGLVVEVRMPAASASASEKMIFLGKAR